MVVASISALKVVRHAAGEMRSDALSCLHGMVYRSTAVDWARALNINTQRVIHFMREPGQIAMNIVCADDPTFGDVYSLHKSSEHLKQLELRYDRPLTPKRQQPPCRSWRPESSY